MCSFPGLFCRLGGVEPRRWWFRPAAEDCLYRSCAAVKSSISIVHLQRKSVNVTREVPARLLQRWRTEGGLRALRLNGRFWGLARRLYRYPSSWERFLLPTTADNPTPQFGSQAHATHEAEGSAQIRWLPVNVTHLKRANITRQARHCTCVQFFTCSGSRRSTKNFDREGDFLLCHLVWFFTVCLH